MGYKHAALTRIFAPALPRSPPIFLTVLLAYGAVASRLGLCEELLCTTENAQPIPRINTCATPSFFVPRGMVSHNACGMMGRSQPLPLGSVGGQGP
jgi:hypothetical protein